jgi:GGDEF domain-containing protein
VGRIEVVDVQEEISFCRVAERMCPSLFSQGSRLEAIPMGSISHLVSATTFGGVAPPLDLTPSEQLTKIIATADKSSPAPVVAVFSVDNVDSLVKQRGTAFVNATLAQLYAAIKETLQDASRIGQVQCTELAAIISPPPTDAPAIARRIIDLVADRCKALATVSAGLFLDPPVSEARMRGDRSTLSRQHALEYARYAASDAGRKGNEVSAFSVRTAISVMQTCRSKQLHRQVVEDCKRFRALGIQNATVENLGAISEFGLPNASKEFVIQASRAAVELDPSNPVLASNLGVFSYWFNEPREAYRAFCSTRDIDPNYEFSVEARCVMAMSLYREFVAGGTVDPDELLELLRFASQQKLPVFRIGLANVEAAISDVMRRGVSLAAPSEGTVAQPQGAGHSA